MVQLRSPGCAVQQREKKTGQQRRQSTSQRHCTWKQVPAGVVPRGPLALGAVFRAVQL